MCEPMLLQVLSIFSYIKRIRDKIEFYSGFIEDTTKIYVSNTNLGFHIKAFYVFKLLAEIGKGSV